VGAAVGTRPSDRERVAALREKGGLDVVILDSSQVRQACNSNPSLDTI
jgi:hypothetical protein